MRLQSKKTVRVKDKVIGGPMPLACLPIVAENKSQLFGQAQELSLLEPDLLEWRIDGFDHAHLIEQSIDALRALCRQIDPIPLIFTCRVDREGGLQTIPRQSRLDLILASIKTRLPDIVDVELCNDEAFISSVIDACRTYNVKLILSFHDFEKTPEDGFILDKLVWARDLGADIAKVAVMPKTCKDVLTLMNVTLAARQKLEIPLVTMAMGEKGIVTRVAGGVFGSDITFAMGKTASAPGQISIQALRQAMATLYTC